MWVKSDSIQPHQNINKVQATSIIPGICTIIIMLYDGNRCMLWVITVSIMATVPNGMPLKALLPCNIFQDAAVRLTEGIFITVEVWYSWILF